MSDENTDTAPNVETTAPTPVNLRNFSIKCGHCSEYQTLCEYSTATDWNIYVFECENDRCDPARSRTLVEIPIELDEYAQRDPTWRHGKSHTGGSADNGQ